MTERNGTVVCFDGVCPMCLKIVSLMRPVWEPRGVGFVPLQAEWVRRRLNLPEAELLGEMRVLTPRGKVLGGADAHGHLWGQVWWLWPLWLAVSVPTRKTRDGISMKISLWLLNSSRLVDDTGNWRNLLGLELFAPTQSLRRFLSERTISGMVIQKRRMRPMVSPRR